jgi:hypothetical protein
MTATVRHERAPAPRRRHQTTGGCLLKAPRFCPVCGEIKYASPPQLLLSADRIVAAKESPSAPRQSRPSTRTRYENANQQQTTCRSHKSQNFQSPNPSSAARIPRTVRVPRSGRQQTPRRRISTGLLVPFQVGVGSLRRMLV